jgi:hypothetical protein
MITRVRQLTAMNIKALRDMELGSNFGATYAEFEGTPAQALTRVERAMCQLAGRDSTRRSLCAVQRKLAAAAPRFYLDGTETAITNYVTVTR